MAERKKIALVTGSTDGVGRYVARELAKRGFHMLIHGRDENRAAGLLAEITKAGGTGRVYLADLASLEAARGLADAVLRDQPRLDLLINNAGIGTSGGQRRTSIDGHELVFAINYLAGFLLAHRLLPLLKKSAPARIVNVSSAGQQAIDFDDVMLTHGYSGIRAYCQSKLAQIMFTLDLAGELNGTGVTVTCLHPATYMDTTMVRRAGVNPLSTVEEGGDAILNLAVGAATEGKTGLYYDGLRQSRANAQAYDEKARSRLRALSLKLAGLPA